MQVAKLKRFSVTERMSRRPNNDQLFLSQRLGVDLRIGERRLQDEADVELVIGIFRTAAPSPLPR